MALGDPLRPAQDFLHRLTTVHVKALPPDSGAPGCFLTAQGKIRVYFTLWNIGPQEYAFEFDAGSSGKWKTELLSVIDQFTFAEKMTLKDQTPELEYRWIFANSTHPLLAQMEPGKTSHHKSDDGSEIRICHHGDADYGRTWISVWGQPGSLEQTDLKKSFLKPKPVLLQEIENWRVLAVRPRVDFEITDTAMPLEVGLRQAIADHKGCYPGQEVIEKIISLGSPPRRLTRIEGEGNVPPRVRKS